MHTLALAVVAALAAVGACVHCAPSPSSVRARPPLSSVLGSSARPARRSGSRIRARYAAVGSCRGRAALATCGRKGRAAVIGGLCSADVRRRGTAMGGGDGSGARSGFGAREIREGGGACLGREGRRTRIDGVGWG